ncbi:MFS transporter [Micromonospora rosaria]|uniref:MFS transporter n=1 Tax=Micromonospora rosaria TaxID=47874 RepID=A0A136PUM3_9ACTN|nr:MFS transporter [Micromonospora rosaria]KXK62122.1 MFS transporter [Micromonospora rosaria]
MVSTAGRFDARSWAVLLVLCGAIFLEGIDVAMLNVALPAIRDDLGLSTGTLSGVVSAYVLGYGGFMLLGGRAADLYGRRRMFLTWLTVFLVFSGLGGFATEGWMLLVARFVTGVAAAFMTPAGLALVTAAFPEGPRRTRALGVYAAIASGGFSLGLVAGGALTELGWRWVFFAPVILAAVLLLAALPLVAPDPPVTRPRNGFDVAGAVSLTGAMLLLVYGVVRLEHGGDGIGVSVGFLAVGAALLALFVAVQRRAADPLVRLGILRRAALVRTNLAALLFMGAFAGFQFMVTLYLQELRGWSPLQTGLAMLLVALDVLIAPTLTPWLVQRYGHTRVLFGGLLAAVAAYALFLPARLDWAYVAMLPTMVLLGLAFGLVYGPLTMAGVEGVDEREHGLAGGLLYTSMQFGMALGISAVTAVSVAVARAPGMTGVTLDAVRAGLVLPLVAVLLAAVVTAFGLRARATTPTPDPDRAPV